MLRAGLLPGNARPRAPGNHGLRRRRALSPPRRPPEMRIRGQGRNYLLLAALCFAQLASAQSSSSQFPSKPIRLVAPFAPGGALDLIARGVAQKLGESVGQPVVVENKAGASGAIGSDLVDKSPPDGYTLLLGATTTHGINPAFNPKSLPYDAVKDFTPVSLVATIPHALVANPRLSLNSVQDLVRLGKQRLLNYGSAGKGSPPQLAPRPFQTPTRPHAGDVPFQGPGPALAHPLGR